MLKLRASSKSARHYIVGLMSGTSADGIDAVVAQISGTGRGLKARLVEHLQKPFSRELRAHILKVCLTGTVAEICELNFLLGKHFARAALAVIRQAGLSPRDIAAIGSHGQTIHHLPRAKTPSTLQIGEPAVIAERTGILTVADFRVRDMAAGGQGAPLVTYTDWALFTDHTRTRILQNIGGIGNLTFLPPNAELNQVMAFDTGPGNMVIDAAVSELSRGRMAFDRDGRWAARGTASEQLLRSMMSHSYLRRQPPKTTGREEFGAPFVREVLENARRLRLRPEDIVASVTAFTAASIADSYKRFVFPKISRSHLKLTQIILGGGGAKNATLKAMLVERLKPLEVVTQSELGNSDAAKEAIAFAILAHETLQGKPSNVPSATGAKRPVILGKITPA